MIGKLKDLTINRDGTQNITLTIAADFREAFDSLFGKDIEVIIKKFSKRRSLDANNFLWHLCSEIAKRSSKFASDGKVDVYREAIRAKGVFDPLLVRVDALDRFIRRWGDKGDGWFVDVIDEYKQRYKIVHAYYGTSTYTSAELSPVIDYLVIKAEELGIPTITDNELAKMMGRWDKQYEKKVGAA